MKVVRGSQGVTLSSKRWTEVCDRAFLSLCDLRVPSKKTNSITERGGLFVSREAMRELRFAMMLRQREASDS